MAIWIAIPILGILLILQTVVASQIPLIHGTTDLIMIAVIAWSLQKRVRTAWQWGIIGGFMVGIVSALPFVVPIISYLIIVLLAHRLRQRVWHVPIFAMFVTTFLGTLVSQTIAVISLRFLGTELPLQEVVFLITLPSLILNLLLAAPAYFLFGDLAKWVYPEELRV
jgi:rod shape-determining protein MreD